MCRSGIFCNSCSLSSRLTVFFSFSSVTQTNPQNPASNLWVTKPTIIHFKTLQTSSVAHETTECFYWTFQLEFLFLLAPHQHSWLLTGEKGNTTYFFWGVFIPSPFYIVKLRFDRVTQSLPSAPVLYLSLLYGEIHSFVTQEVGPLS